MTDTYRQFVRSETVTWDLDDPWCTNRRDQSRLGKRFERVRILDSPPTEGQRHLLDNARRNAAVGEDIRTLPRTRAEQLRLPAEDFWIFDARVVAFLAFGDGESAHARRSHQRPGDGPAVLPILRGRLAPRRALRPGVTA